MTGAGLVSVNLVRDELRQPDHATRQSPVSRIRRTIVALCCVVVAVAGLSPSTTGAQEPGEALDARQQLLDERAAASARLTEAESALAAANQAVVDSEQALAELLEQREQVDTDIAATRAARELPLEVRRAIAVEVYMAGDPAANSMIQELVDGSSGIDGVRDRALYNSVVDWASANLDRLDAELEALLSTLAELDVDIPDLESLLEEQRLVVVEAQNARDALVALVADIDHRLRTLNRAILTGLPVDTVSTRPILVVKIDNVSAARPQHGITAADIVIEEKVEAGLTRLAALFQSTGADPVGPIRSARTSDVHLFANMGSPLFAYSGANMGVGQAVAASPMIDVGATSHSGLYYREASRRAPHNLYSRTSRLWAAGSGASPPQAIFEFRSDGEPIGAGARSASGVDVSYGTGRASFTWSPDRNGWTRTQDGSAHTAAGGVQVAPENVVVRFTNYVPSPADARSPEAVVTGSGDLWVLSAGQVVQGRWEQASATSPTRWLDAEGNPIRLTPGRTWILLPEPGNASLR